MNLSWANQIAKTALKTAQQKIDSVLDIRPDDLNQSSSTVVLDDPLLTPVPEDQPSEETIANLFAVPDTGQDGWGSAWGGLPSDPELVVDSEPNPIRDEAHNVTHLLDHSPSSNSSDAVDSPVKTLDYTDIDLHEDDDKQSNSPITCEPLLPPHHETASQPGHHDDSLTVASSDIEVIRNVDAWSVSSSRLTNDHIPVPSIGTKGEATAALEAQLQMAEQRRKELKTSNDVLQKTNVQLQQRIVILNQQQNTMKKELEDKKKECEDVLEEGKKMSDYSGKQSREIRRLKSELSDLEKIKVERKRYKDEKTQAEETIELQKEELSNLKNMVKTLETTSEQIKKENSQSVASNEAVQKHIEAQDKKLNEFENDARRLDAEKADLEEINRALTREIEQLHSAQWADRLAGERANETALTVGQDLSEAREQIERLTSQLNYTRMQLENTLDQQSSIAETIAKANAPLLDELNELKSELASEQQIAEECDRKARQIKKEYDEFKKKLAQNDEKHNQNLQILRSEIDSLLKKQGLLDSEVSRLKQEKQSDENELRNTKRGYEERIQEMHNDFLVAGEESINLRKSLKEFKEDNDQLRAELSELKKSRETAPSPAPTPIPQAIRLDLPVEMPLTSTAVNLPPMAYTFANSGQAAQVELESLSVQYESSLKRIAHLESETKRNIQLEIQIKTLQRELKELNHHYNQLLELDGERLEKLEEQAHDIIDLRHLLKEQLIAFADAKEREEENKKSPDPSSE